MRDQHDGVTADLDGAQAKRAWSTPMIIVSAMPDAQTTASNVGSDVTNVGNS